MPNFYDNNRPIYLQIADDIGDRILREELKPGERVPSVREYAAMTAVNVNTVVRAYEYLADENIIFNKRGIGFFVTAKGCENVALKRLGDYSPEWLHTVFDKLAFLGITPLRLAELYTEYQQSKDNQQSDKT